MSERFGSYELTRRLAAGGMGEVYLARHVDSGLPVVIKRVLPHLAEDAELKALFFSEARLAASVHHPHIARILELGEADGRWFLALEYVDGWSLATLLAAASRTGQALPEWAVARVGRDAAAALQAAHSARDARGKALNIVHGDVSPQNLLLGRDGLVRLIDFGVARASAQALAEDSKALRGKYPYLAPELLDDVDNDARGDQFALGAVLWEALAGRRLFEGENDAHTLELVERCEVPILDSPLWPPLARMLARDPRARFDSMAAVGAALAQVAEDEGWREDGAALARLAGELLGETTERAGPAATLGNDTPAEVPEPTTSYLARREVEEAVLGAVRQGGCVTVTGDPGAGSSRLVRRLAAQLGAPLVDVEGLPAAAATSAIASAPGPGLLVVDGAKSPFTPTRPLLVAAHAPLGIPGERVVPLPPWNPEDAAQLWADRSPEEAPTPLPASPLVIELLAGMGPDAGSSPTLEALLATAWPRLAPFEQVALAQLSAPGREVTLEELEALVDLTAFPDAPWALDVVQELAERGWVQTLTHPEANGEVRFRVPSAVRAWAKAHPPAA